MALPLRKANDSQPVLQQAKILSFPIRALQGRCDEKSFPHETRQPDMLVGHLKVWRQRHLKRRLLRQELRDQPTSVVLDAGYSPKSLAQELAKPFWRA